MHRTAGLAVWKSKNKRLVKLPALVLVCSTEGMSKDK